MAITQSTHAMNDETQNFVISYELLALLEWLIVNEHEGCRKLIQRAVKQGFNVNDARLLQNEHPEELQQNIIDFLALLDNQLNETVTGVEVETVLESTMLPSINNVDPSQYDQNAMQASIAKARAAAHKHKENPKETFCKELLKRWKPGRRPWTN